MSDINKKTVDRLRKFTEQLESGEPIKATEVTRHETTDGPMHERREVVKPSVNTPPQRFRWCSTGYTRWKFGVCVYMPAFYCWEIHTFGLSRVMLFQKDPWESLGQVVGDCDKFEWIDNDFGWHQ